jgi:hypothetical protein
MASEVRAEAAEVADVFITGEVLQSNTIDYPQGFVIKPSENPKCIFKVLRILKGILKGL